MSDIYLPFIDPRPIAVDITELGDNAGSSAPPYYQSGQYNFGSNVTPNNNITVNNFLICGRYWI